MHIAFYTFGCKANQYDTQVMQTLVEKAGFTLVDFSQKADVYVINSCTVTAQSDAKVRQLVNKVAREHPHANVIVCGCYAQREAEKLLENSNISAVMGTSNRKDIVSVIENLNDSIQNYVEDIQAQKEYEETGGTEIFEKSRAQIKIQDGCDRYCSYCIIPYVRGRVRSRKVESVLKEVERAAKAGYQEIVLTGIRLMAYGQDTGESFLKLLEEISNIKGVERIRLGSLDPDALDETFIRGLACNTKVCPHFHLSLQSGSDGVLKRMNRRYNTLQFQHIVDLLKNNFENVALTTDVMVGFVGETESEHQESMAFVQKIGFSKLHVFPYSVREGTKASKMKGHLSNQIKKERANQMIALGEQLSLQYLEKQIGREHKVLFEQAADKTGEYIGYSEYYVPVVVKAHCLPQGIVNVKITSREKNNLYGTMKKEDTNSERLPIL